MVSPMGSAGETASATPLCQETPARHPAALPSLLIVDDIADNRTILARRFQRRGFEIVEASSGREALELIATRHFDTVLLNVMMPEMDGTEVLRRIREQHSASAMPVIMVTAKSQSEDIVAALALGANDYVTKPVEFDVALARVTSQIERKRAETEVRQGAERLRLLNEELEARVNERTARLFAANQQLQDEIVQRHETEARNAYLARHDVLTGLGNRLMLREGLERALGGSTAGDGAPTCVLFIDLDGFKSINDGLGHALGDAVLKLVATRLRSETEPRDEVVRLGGDEFAVLTTGTGGIERASRLAGRLIEALSESATIEGNLVHVGASIGLAVAGVDGMTGEELMKAADMALYRAKSEGRGVWRVFDSAMDACAQARRLLELDLRNALSEGELALFYQPLIDMKTKAITGFEALMRWRHPERGYVSPADFIPVAEDLGLIVPWANGLCVRPAWRR